ncbi:ABC transporter ATP-binding protein [Actinopolymorpha alba]|uniref:ABC transporter ATP-binding protein n=1 Tax=Actinopolymorpha alba TaxID=533267 RepID=UPI00036B648E|nr:ATP-binding cassette domain-containing protein [Actinopolymorpha alba]
MTATDGGRDLVRCVEVARTYGRGAAAVVAIHAMSCVVPPAARVAVTGPSGSGKSTLLHLLAGLDRPSAGTIEWPGLGGDPVDRPGTVGFVFQGPSLLPPLDVSENVELPLLLAGFAASEARERSSQALAMVDAVELAGRLPEELSGGQAQRVAVARVLACRPRLILADEPTGQLDAGHRDQVVRALIESAAHLGASLVVATHDVAVANQLSTQWQMRDGRLTCAEEPARVPHQAFYPVSDPGESC